MVYNEIEKQNLLDATELIQKLFTSEYSFLFQTKSGDIISTEQYKNYQHFKNPHFEKILKYFFQCNKKLNKGILQRRKTLNFT